MTDTEPATAPEFLESEAGVSIAYHRLRGKSPGVIFFGGFMSDMTGSKALALEAYCRKQGRAFVRFDYQGHGASSGRFEDGTIGQWAKDALAVFDRLTEGRQVLVGSSMGGWIALLTGLQRQERVAALATVAAAPDFTEDLIWAQYDDERKATIARDGVLYEKSDYGERAYAITHKLIEDGRRHLLLRGPIPLDCPTRLMHGMQDPDVPWQRSLLLAEKLAATDLRVILVKDGDHRLSREQDLTLLTRTVGSLLGDK